MRRNENNVVVCIPSNSSREKKIFEDLATLRVWVSAGPYIETPAPFVPWLAVSRPPGQSVVAIIGRRGDLSDHAASVLRLFAADHVQILTEDTMKRSLEPFHRPCALNSVATTMVCGGPSIVPIAEVGDELRFPNKPRQRIAAPFKGGDAFRVAASRRWRKNQ